MTKLFSMPFMVDRYRRKTICLSLEEHGAYLLLLCAMWENKGCLPASDSAISRALGVSAKEWLRLKPRLWHFFTVYGEGDQAVVTQETLQEQWNYAKANSEKQAVKGSLGGKAKREKERLLKTLSHGYSSGQHTGSNSGSSPGSSPALAILESKNITSTSNSQDRKEPDAAESVPLPETPKALDRRGSDLAARLNTPLMRSHSRG